MNSAKLTLPALLNLPVQQGSQLRFFGLRGEIVTHNGIHLREQAAV